MEGWLTRFNSERLTRAKEKRKECAGKKQQTKRRKEGNEGGDKLERKE
jgi:hypothetical protein